MTATPLVLGHRGSRQPGPENTPAAVAAALAAGADGVEIDVRLSSDGVCVCCHDPAVASLTVAETPAATLAGVGVPTLEEMLDAVGTGPALLVCEVKNGPGDPGYGATRPPVAEAAARLLATRGPRVLVSSFDWFSLEVASAAGIAGTAFLAHPGVALRAGVGYAAEHGHAQVHAHLSDVLAAGPAGVRQARLAGVEVMAWTVTGEAELAGLAACGVRGVICDDPVAALGWRARLAGAAAEGGPPWTGTP